MSGSVIVCNSCRVKVPTQERGPHYKSEWHRYNIKRKIEDLEPVTEALFNLKLQELHAHALAHAPIATKCKLCGKTFKSDAAYNQHLNSKTHKKKAAASSRQVSQRPSPQLSAKEPAAIVIKDSLTLPGQGGRPVISQEFISEDDEEESKINMEEDDEEEEDEEEDGLISEEALLRDSIPPTDCFFCHQPNGDIETNIAHMGKNHSFFLPYLKYVVDIEGVMSYLGAKVGAGKMCVGCNRGFVSLPAVRNHMTDKNHCNIPLDGGEDWDQMMIYYDFEKEENALVSVTEGKKKKVVSMNEMGELVMNDGSIIGHRALVREYRQNTRVTNPKEAEVFAKASMRYLAMPGYGLFEKEQKKHLNYMKGVFRKKAHNHLKVGINANKVGRMHFVNQNLQ